LKALLTSLRPATLLLILVSVWLGAVLIERVWHGTSAAELLATPARSYTPLKAGIELPSLQLDLDLIRRNSLFYASRRFFVPQVTPALLPRPDYLLAGTFIIPRKPAVALLVEVASGSTRRVLQGDQLGGWTVGSVESGRVILTYEGQSIEIVRPVRVQSSGLTVTPMPAPPADGIKVLGSANSAAGEVDEASAANSPAGGEIRLYRRP
jgi:hypothetical protein